jgi:ankyrin repeat protein
MNTFDEELHSEFFAIENLPTEILLLILDYLSPVEMIKFGLTNKVYYQLIVNYITYWRTKLPSDIDEIISENDSSITNNPYSLFTLSYNKEYSSLSAPAKKLHRLLKHEYFSEAKREYAFKLSKEIIYKDLLWHLSTTLTNRTHTFESLISLARRHNLQEILNSFFSIAKEQFQTEDGYYITIADGLTENHWKCLCYQPFDSFTLDVLGHLCKEVYQHADKDGNTILAMAVQNRDTKLVEYLVSAIEVVDSVINAIYKAIDLNETEIIKLLTKANLAEEHYLKILFYAASSEAYIIFSLLWSIAKEKNLDITICDKISDYSLLYNLCNHQKPDLNLVGFLLQENVDSSQQPIDINVLQILALYGNVNLLNVFLEIYHNLFENDFIRKILIQTAIYARQYKFIEYIIDHSGYSFYFKDYSALLDHYTIYASMVMPSNDQTLIKEHLRIMHLLVNHDINTINQSDLLGFTRLFYVLLFQDDQFTMQLVREQPTLQLTLPCTRQQIDDIAPGDSLLHIAARRNNIELMTLLLQKTPDDDALNQKNSEGRTPVDVAGPDVLSLLEEKNCNHISSKKI